MEHFVKDTLCLWRVDLVDLLRYGEQKITQNFSIIGNQDTDFGGLSNSSMFIK